MNNLLIGSQDDRSGAGSWVYYETIAGGQGGRPPRPDLPNDTPHDAMNGVHTGMTNTKNTPVEAFERAFPMRVRRYRLRRGSGGAGSAAGGEGIERELEVLVDATVSLITERRTSAALGPRRWRSGRGRGELAAARRRREPRRAPARQVHDPSRGGRRRADPDPRWRRAGVPSATLTEELGERRPADADELHAGPAGADVEQSFLDRVVERGDDRPRSTPGPSCDGSSRTSPPPTSRSSHRVSAIFPAPASRRRSRSARRVVSTAISPGGTPSAIRRSSALPTRFTSSFGPRDRRARPRLGSGRVVLEVRRTAEAGAQLADAARVPEVDVERRAEELVGVRSTCRRRSPGPGP